MFVRMNPNKNKTVFRFRILHDGWDSDNEGWVEQDDSGEYKIYSTNHDQIYEMDKKELEAKLFEYQSVVLGTYKALNFILDENPSQS